MELYLDLLMLLNFLVDLLLLLGTNRLAGFRSHWRLIPAAALGAVYSGVCLIPRTVFLAHPLWRLVCLMIMAGIAFGMDSSAIRRGALFLLLSLSLGGLALAFQQSRFEMILLEAGILLLLLRTAFGGQAPGNQYIPLEITEGGKTVSMIALRDTGNRLKDPITGQPVIVISPEKAAALTGLTADQLSHPMETMVKSRIPGLRIIPYNAVGCGCGMLLSKKFSHVVIDGKRQEAIIGFAPEGLGQNGLFEALTGGAL